MVDNIGEIDQFDRKILEAVAADGRISVTDLSERVGLSKTPCKARLQRLMAEGYISGHEITTESKFPTIKVHMRYDAKRKPLINHLARVSKPGLRVYKPCNDLRPIRNGLATRILTTSQGVMTDREARRRKIGGEVLCEVF